MGKVLASSEDTFLTCGPSQAQSEYQEGDPEWCPDDQVSYETQAKVLGIRLLVSWLAGLQSDFERYANPVLQLLDTVLAHDGDLQGDDNVRYDVWLVFLQTGLSFCFSAHDRSRLRLAAACGLLKLAQNTHYHDLITQEQFQRLALSIQVHNSLTQTLSITLLPL